MLHVDLIALDGIKYSGDVHEVVLPTPDGQIAIFENHAALVSLASQGIVSLRIAEHDADDILEHFAVSGGMIDVRNNTVSVLVDEALHSDELVDELEQHALDEALRLRRDAGDQVSLDHAQQLIDRQAVRLQVAKLRRRSKHRQ